MAGAGVGMCGGGSSGGSKKRHPASAQEEEEPKKKPVRAFNVTYNWDPITQQYEPLLDLLPPIKDLDKPPPLRIRPKIFSSCFTLDQVHDMFSAPNENPIPYPASYSKIHYPPEPVAPSSTSKRLRLKKPKSTAPAPSTENARGLKEAQDLLTRQAIVDNLDHKKWSETSEEKKAGYVEKNQLEAIKLDKERWKHEKKGTYEMSGDLFARCRSMNGLQHQSWLRNMEKQIGCSSSSSSSSRV
jgi:hypothetical protein